MTEWTPAVEVLKAIKFDLSTLQGRELVPMWAALGATVHVEGSDVEGTVDAIHSVFRLREGNELRNIEGVTEILTTGKKPFAVEGDGGKLILRKPDGGVVGIVLAGGGKHFFAVPVDDPKSISNLDDQRMFFGPVADSSGPDRPKFGYTTPASAVKIAACL